MTCRRCCSCPCRCGCPPLPPPPYIPPAPVTLPCGCRIGCCTCVPILPSGGCYYVKCKASGTYINNFMSYSTAGNQIIGWHADTTDNMKWKLLLKAGSNTEYYFQNTGTGMCLGAAESLRADGSRVLITLQQTPLYFTIMRVYGDTYIFNVRSQAAHYCIDLDNGSQVDGATLGWCRWSGNTCQQWFLEPVTAVSTPAPAITGPTAVTAPVQVGFPKPFINPKPSPNGQPGSLTIAPGCYFITCVATNTTINNSGWGTTAGNPLIGWQKVEQTNSKWKLVFKPGSTTEYYIQNVANNMAIGYLESLTGGAVMATIRATPFYFTLKAVGGGAYIIYSSGTNYALEVENSSCNDGASIIFSPAHGGTSQNWTFEATEPK